MIEQVFGDLTESTAGVLCHQTNFEGVMGAGVAFAIRRKLLTESQYQKYVQYCNQHGDKALGTTQFLQIGKKRFIANCFSQRDFIKDGTLTDYDALRHCLYDVHNFAAERGLSVAIPAGMGCGIAGGNWDIVSGMIYAIFSKGPMNCQIVTYSNYATPGIAGNESGVLW